MISSTLTNNDSVTQDSQTKETRKGPPPGAMGYFEEIEQSLEKYITAEPKIEESSGGTIDFFQQFNETPAQRARQPERLSLPFDINGAIIFNRTVETVQEVGGAIAELGQVILGRGESKPTQPKTEQEAKKIQEQAFVRERNRDLQENLQNVKAAEQAETEKFAKSISKGEFSLAEAAQALSVSAPERLGKYQVLYTWTERQEKMEADKHEQESQELAQVTNSADLSQRLDAHEGQSMTSSSGAIVSAG